LQEGSIQDLAEKVLDKVMKNAEEVLLAEGIDVESKEDLARLDAEQVVQILNRGTRGGGDSLWMAYW
jgi:hypothetical protein